MADDLPGGVWKVSRTRDVRLSQGIGSKEGRGQGFISWFVNVTGDWIYYKLTIKMFLKFQHCSSNILNTLKKKD